MVELQNITVKKAGIKLFENFNWRIEDGEHWLIKGGNGSGKTTLLEVIAGITHITGGEISIDFINGATWDERYNERRKAIHYIPSHAIDTFLKQNQGQYYQQRYYDIGDERVPLVSDILGSTNEKWESLQLPESFDINALVSLAVNRLSNGQLKKVLLLKILLMGPPRMLLLDYPFEGLDARSRRDLCDFIDHLVTAYSTQIIVVDHHYDLPKALNRTLYIDDFKITQPSLISAPAHVSPSEVNGSTLSAKVSRDIVIDIRNLKIQYRETIVLDNFNWTIRKGERWALVGRNGAGKTTLFSMIFADHPMAYSQEVYLFGKRRGSGESIWDIKRRITYLGPELMSYLSPNHIAMTARTYIRSVVSSTNEFLFNELSQAFDASKFLDTPVRHLSSGQLQVTLIIHCFLTKKEVLLLDEPFQFLDTQQRSHFTRFLRSRLNNGVTLILITHDERDLHGWTDHIQRL